MSRFNPEYAAGGQAVGGLMGGLFGDSQYQNPYGGATSQMGNQFLQELQKYRQSLMPVKNQYQTAISGLLNDPSALIDHIMQHYHESPYATHQIHDAEEGANATAAAGGYLGTPQEQEAVSNHINQLSDSDENEYLQRVLNQYRGGMQGEASLVGQLPGLYNAEGQTYGSMASLEAARQSAENKHNSGFFGGLMSALGTAAGFL